MNHVDFMRSQEKNSQTELLKADLEKLVELLDRLQTLIEEIKKILS